MATDNYPTITFNDLVEEVNISLRDMHRFLKQQKNKYGNKYNYRNNFEMLGTRFSEDPQRLIAEYNLILDKKSYQPASVREPIKFIVQTAINRLITKKAKEQQDA